MYNQFRHIIWHSANKWGNASAAVGNAFPSTRVDVPWKTFVFEHRRQISRHINIYVLTKQKCVFHTRNNENFAMLDSQRDCHHDSLSEIRSMRQTGKWTGKWARGKIKSRKPQILLDVARRHVCQNFFQNFLLLVLSWSGITTAVAFWLEHSSSDQIPSNKRDNNQ